MIFVAATKKSSAMPLITTAFYMQKTGPSGLVITFFTALQAKGLAQQ